MALMRRYFSILVFLGLAACVSCGPSYRAELDVPSADDSVFPSGTREFQSYVYVADMIDARPQEALAELEGRSIAPRGDVSKAAVEGVKKAIVKLGFNVSDTAPVVLSGEVRTWFAKVTGGFSARTDAEAALYLEILDPANKKIYSGVYRGYSSIESPNLDDDDIKQSLKTALSEAIAQIAKDKQLVRLLAAF